MNLKHLILPAAIALVAGASTASAQLFTPGDLVVSVYGSLTSSVSGSGGSVVTDGATPITLEEYSFNSPTSITSVLTDQLPTTGVGGNVGIQGEDGSSSEGTLQLSGNGEYLTIGGYDGNAANLGIQTASDSINSDSFADGTAWSASTIALAQSSDVDVPRVAATIDAYGNVNTSTTFTGPYDGNNPRAVYSPDGTSFYISGQGLHNKVSKGVYADEGGIFTTTLGTTGTANTTPIYTTVSTRDVLEYGGNLYYSTDQLDKSGTQAGIFGYSGTPTTAQGIGTQITPASVVLGGTTFNLSPEDFAFANSTTLYVADTGDPKGGVWGLGGIQKWSFANGTWGLDYTLAPSTFIPDDNLDNTPTASGESGFEDLALQVVGGNVDIYAVSYTVGDDALGNGLYGVVDSLSNTSAAVADDETVTELEASPGISGTADYNFKGVSFAPSIAPVPEPSTWALGLAGAGALLAFRRRRKQA